MKKYALYAVIAMAILACIYAYLQFLLPLDVFLWDESHHGFYGMQIYRDLCARDWGAFWAHTNNQALWMPLHSWLDGIFLLIFGFSYTSARLSSLFLFFMCSILVYLIGLELSKEKGWVIGAIASVLFLTSPMMLHLATVNMQEMLGTFICLLTTYFMVRNISVDARWKYLAMGFLLSVAYWSKQNYAMIIMLGAGLFQLSLLWDIRNEPVKKARPNKFYTWRLDNVFIVLGFLPLFALWWVTPPFARKYGLAVTYRQGAVAGGTSVTFGFVKTAIFYVQSFITSYNLSFWVALGGVSAAVVSFFFFRDKKIRIISLMFYANLIFVGIMSFAQERYLSSAAPLVFLLLGYFGLAAFERLNNIKRAAVLAYVVTAIITASFIYDLSCLTRYTKEVANRSIMSFIYKDSLNKFSPPFMFGLIGRPAFTYPQDFTKNKYKDFKVPPASSLRDVMDFFSSNIERNKSISTMISYAEISPYVIYWHFRGWGATVMSVNDLGFNPKHFWMADNFIDIQVSEDSPYYSDGLDKRWNDVSKVLLREGVIKLAAKKEFADLGLTAKIYKREKLFYFK
ncbi:MAG: glycosyltransferase family 39 protein [bacterium]